MEYFCQDALALKVCILENVLVTKILLFRSLANHFLLNFQNAIRVEPLYPIAKYALKTPITVPLEDFCFHHLKQPMPSRDFGV